MTRLHQILAVEKDIRRTAKTRETQAHRDLQTPQLMIGITRSYRPINDEDDTLPDESTLYVTDLRNATVGATDFGVQKHEEDGPDQFDLLFAVHHAFAPCGQPSCVSSVMMFVTSEKLVVLASFIGRYAVNSGNCLSNCWLVRTFENMFVSLRSI